MKINGVIGTTVLSLALGVGGMAFAQDQREEQKDKPAPQEEKKAPEKSPKQEVKPAPAQQEKSAKPEEKPAAAQKEQSAKPADKPAAQHDKNAQPAEKNAKQQGGGNAKPAQQNANAKPSPGHNGVASIPQANYQAHFGREHTFRVSEGDYRNHQFQYGGYWFGFSDPWPSNWLYSQDVYVVDINGVYYLCNASFPGVNLALSFTS